MGMRLRFEMPMKLSSKTNSRLNWLNAWRRNKRQRARTREYYLAAVAARQPYVCTLSYPFHVYLTRIIGPRGRKLDAHDNLREAFKSIVDEVAAILGVNDGDKKKVRWHYAEERGEAWGVRVEID